MGTKRMDARKQSARIAFCGMISALSAVLMLSGGLIPVMTYVSPLIAGVLLMPVLVDYGRKYAWTVWLSTALIVLLIDADKEAAFFYLFVGCYPVLKWDIDRLQKKRLAFPIKLLFFSGSLAAMYAILAFLLRLDAVLADFAELGLALTVLFFVLMVAVLMMYDRLLIRLLILYANKLRPRLKSLIH